MAPFEALYGRPCKSPVCWIEAGETAILGPQLVQDTTEKIKLIKQRLLTAQSRQKSYADKRRRPLEFEVGDYVFLKVKPRHDIIRFGNKGKLAPRYIGPFEIIQRVGSVSYRLALPLQLQRIHDVFHVSMLRRYILDPSHVTPVEELEVNEDVSYETHPVAVVDRKEQVLRNRVIPLVKVIWQHHGMEEATWELESEIQTKYPHLLQ
ncbi:hypothetical protein LguiB_005673 [Lonicera macranthoides]